ncbi:hypothetical protein AKJ37_07420 [candidate division MSBL1 archaeon SCGC-AAA259I09]|uniref:CobQ/CobB/MinD/ParA nucleotide binding domain-containing protein n=6 Tax=candidate division MSBL1 TaxID=215777 RepID=A0A133UWL2_9EURY|nr:hypothetical protein AKJ61_04325 [candidate division MSBL1 archaeon SCGC-AAA259B11]KXA90969.1 hypothetical protein AKJ57_02995 [candidate division MSBL1 archaeon SCGC-AAA259A05]KXA94646.1 hypothetical protein AKJ37_07420 [candidate division MSBL1 archaeon SCGC-AAA259I09]KXA97034.1 hypothetical protein AKJ39_03790 [candidate division MSBL1 archaeon SCGC-AAA259J03]KXA98576.1 hypothetical protein AKJ41_06460 [candidate division MSBL1 archaeon SCGC-AAA259O05]
MTKRRKKATEGKTKVIGFGGKGGVGKTTLAALFLRLMGEMDSPAILAVDSDPNTCLPGVLGAEGYQTLGDMVEGYKGGRLPPRKFRQEFNTLLLKNEQEFYDLLPMGRNEGQGCYCSVNDLLRSAFREFVLKGNYAYDFVVMDCEAGIEHISRKTSSFIDDFVIATDSSRMSLNTIKNIRNTQNEVKIDVNNLYIVANRVEDGEMLDRIEDLSGELGMTFLGRMPEDETLKRLNFKGKSIFELPDDSPAYLRMREMANVILS